MSILVVQLASLAFATPGGAKAGVVLDGAIVSPTPHSDHQRLFGDLESTKSFPVPGLLPDETPGPDAVVYGYQAYWDDDLNAVPWDELSHIALFAAEVDVNGQLSGTSRWDQASYAVQLAEPYGVKVHLCVLNFSSSELGQLLGSATARATLISSLRTWVDSTGAHGVNIDFEGMPSSARTDLVQFTKDLATEFGDEVVLATPAVDWTNAWDYRELSKHADLFIMGYAYHYSGSSQAGPNDPLWGGSPWSAYSLDWSVRDYLDEGADPERVILGLPLYGFRWPVASNSVPATATGSGSSIFYAEALAQAQQHGERWDANSATPYYFDGTRQGWYSNEASLRERIDYARDSGIAGVGFWALHYDDGDEALWSMVRETTTDPTTGDPDPVDDNGTDTPGSVRAEAGRPFLAYVGDTVILSAEGSVAPADALLTHSWTQVSGPRVDLASPLSANPSFLVRSPGTHTFELTVAADGVTSDPDRTFVVVLDPQAGRRHAGCSHLGLSGAALCLVPVLAFRRRRYPRR